MPVLVRDLIRRQVALIVGNTPAVLAAKAATKTMPIVFASGDDPADLVESFNRPGGNVTGVSFLNSALAAKRLELLHQIVSNAKLIAAMLQNPVSSGIEAERKDLLSAGQVMGQQLVVLDVNSEREMQLAARRFESRLRPGQYQREIIRDVSARYSSRADSGDRDGVAPFDHVIVREQMPPRRNDERAAGGRFVLALRARRQTA